MSEPEAIYQTYRLPWEAVAPAPVHRTDYKVIEAETVEELEMSVKTLIAVGWHPIGGVSCSLAVVHERFTEYGMVRGGTSLVSNVLLHKIFAQAMVKE